MRWCGPQASGARSGDRSLQGREGPSLARALCRRSATTVGDSRNRARNPGGTPGPRMRSSSTSSAAGRRRQRRCGRMRPQERECGERSLRQPCDSTSPGAGLQALILEWSALRRVPSFVAIHMQSLRRESCHSSQMRTFEAVSGSDRGLDRHPAPEPSAAPTNDAPRNAARFGRPLAVARRRDRTERRRTRVNPWSSTNRIMPPTSNRTRIGAEAAHTLAYSYDLADLG
jgi:hypothetical protein